MAEESQSESDVPELEESDSDDGSMTFRGDFRTYSALTVGNPSIYIGSGTGTTAIGYPNIYIGSVYRLINEKWINDHNPFQEACALLAERESAYKSALEIVENAKKDIGSALFGDNEFGGIWENGIIEIVCNYLK